MDDVMAVTRAPGSAKGIGQLAMSAIGRIARPVRDRAPARLTLAAVPTAPRQARNFTAQALRRWQAAPGAIQAAEIIVSELVTNAYRAAIADAARTGVPGTGPAGRISLVLSRMPGQVVIEISDHSPDLPVRTDAGADAENGRGLVLVQACSEQWGYRRTPSGGKVVYAILSLPGKHAAEEGQS